MSRVLISELILGLLIYGVPEMGRKRAVVSSSGLRNQSTSENFIIMKSKVGEDMIGPMVEFIAANGSTTKCTAMVGFSGLTNKFIVDNTIRYY